MVERAYNHFAPPLIDGSGYNFDRIPERSGDEKNVFKIDYEGIPLAAKIFRPSSPKVKTESGAEKGAIAEFSLYRSLKHTPLGIYVPEAHGLISGPSGRIVGLAVEWVEGKPLWELERPCLTIQELESMEGTILAAADNMGFYFNEDVFGSDNIMFTEGRSSRLVFAECKQFEPNKYNKYESYHEDVHNFFTMHKKHYTEESQRRNASAKFNIRELRGKS
jgi:hypothetical protein